MECSKCGNNFANDLSQCTWCKNQMVDLAKDLDEQLKEIQRKREERIEKARKDGTIKCLHDQCPECKGTGLNSYAQICIHGIACPCLKCSPTYGN